jgi:hypothetical protein
MGVLSQVRPVILMLTPGSAVPVTGFVVVVTGSIVGADGVVVSNISSESVVSGIDVLPTLSVAVAVTSLTPFVSGLKLPLSGLALPVSSVHWPLPLAVVL